MAQNNDNQEWQELQVRMKNMFAGYFENDIPRIEYKTQGILHLLEMPEESRQKIPKRVPDL